MLLTRNPQLTCVSILASLVTWAGCSRGPSRIPLPELNLEAAAAGALELYDADGSQALDLAESAHCPGVKMQFKAYDSDGNGQISAEEFAERLRSLRKSRVGLTRLRCAVRLNGKELADAKVIMEPEPYLGDEIKLAEGTTNPRGFAQLGIPEAELPTDQQGIRAVHYGTYKVRITHPRINLPSKYNRDTELGYETVPDDPIVAFSLTTP